MKPNDAKFEEMRILICELVDGTITPGRRAQLNQILTNDPEAVNHYIDFLDIQVLIKSNISNIEKDFSIPLYSDEIQELTDLWHQLAKEERSAPEIEIVEEKPQRELIQKVVYPPREKRTMSKIGIFTVMSAAAMVLFFLFLRFAPTPKGLQVAVLFDSINAKWADMDGTMEKGAPLVTGTENLLLREGYAELLFNNDTRVTLEGPAEFQILTEDQIKLRYGRLYAIVPQEAIGFTVTTQTAKVIDLGTEFGVEANPYGNTYLCVIKGKTSLIAGDKFNKGIIEVSKGIAKKISGMTQAVSDAVFEDRLFVRSIDSAEGILWRGQTEFNLADVVGGGNGFGTGQDRYGIDLKTGRMEASPSTQPVMKNGYIPISKYFIDGVFSPDAKHGPVQVTSEGHLFEGCPSTDGYSRGCIYYYKAGQMLQPNPNMSEEQGLSAIWMHSNQGITYSLKKIRKAIPEVTIQRFLSEVCMRSGTIRAYQKQIQQGSSIYPPKVDIFVLIDGQIRFERRELVPDDGSVSIEIPVLPEDQYLSLVVTDSGSGDFDETYFIQPSLVLISQK